MSDFDAASGLSSVWVNHMILAVVGTVVVIAAGILITFLVHKIDAGEANSQITVFIMLCFVVMIVFLFLGFLNNFWV